MAIDELRKWSEEIIGQIDGMRKLGSYLDRYDDGYANKCLNLAGFILGKESISRTDLYYWSQHYTMRANRHEKGVVIDGKLNKDDVYADIIYWHVAKFRVRANWLNDLVNYGNVIKCT